MSAQIHLCSIAARHEFSDGGLWTEAAFVPSIETQRQLRRERLMLKESPGALHLIGEAPQADEGTMLRFGLVPRDRAFGLYTQMPASAEGEALTLTDEQTADRFDAGLRRVAPLAVVEIDLAKMRRAKSLPCNYALRFAARRTYWKYYFVGAPLADDASVVDADGEIIFERGEVDFYNGLHATVFLSATPIPMRQTPAQRFELRAGDRLLYQRLPNASLDRMGTHAGSDMLVSEIYVNR